MRLPHGVLAAITLLLSPAPARAQTCPPNQADFDAWTWIHSSNSGDGWLVANICANAERRQTITDLVINHMGLDENWSHWQAMITPGSVCNPDSWGGRAIAGGFAAQITGNHRDNDSLAHTSSPGAILPNNETVVRWLSQFVSYYVSEEGYQWQCLATGDAPGPGDGFTFASNPSSNSALSVYFPWFWNKTVFDRASTLVHEAAHEFAGHIGDDQCANGASCDTAFMAANAQTMQLIYQAQAIDTYRRAPGSRDLHVVNFGGGACGYLPLLPDQERFDLVQVMVNKLMNVFAVVPPVSQYPASARIDNLPGSLYAPGAVLGGSVGDTYRIDRYNASRWPCGAVCDPADYTFPNGERACHEAWQPGNAAINAQNRARCNDLNAQVAAGVTAEEHSLLRSQVWHMTPCIQGVSQEFLDATCDQVKVRARHVDTIEDNWPLPDDIGYNYSASEAIRDCQVRFCSERNLEAWNDAASEVCYEWDDPSGCMPLLCGDLEELAEDPGRESQAYFERVVCRASELGRRIPGIRQIETICTEVFNDCIIEERYLPLWLEQLAGDDCWSDALPAPAPDPLFVDQRLALGRLSAERFIAADRTPQLLGGECLVREAECEALQATLQAVLAKILSLKAQQRQPWERPPGPDPWDRRVRRFDRSLEEAMTELGAALRAAGPDATPLWRDARIRRAAAMPEAQVALAELVGRDTYLRSGGVHFARGAMSPRDFAQFSGPDAMADPHGLSTEGMEDELAALQAVSARLGERGWQALRARAGALEPTTYARHLIALLEARSGMELEAALQALEADLQQL